MKIIKKQNLTKLAWILVLISLVHLAAYRLYPNSVSYLLNPEVDLLSKLGFLGLKALFIFITITFISVLIYIITDALNKSSAVIIRSLATGALIGGSVLFSSFIYLLISNV